MKSPVEREPQKDKRLLPSRGEGNQIPANIPQSETTHNSEIGEIKRHD